ncbi:YraN family protein [Paenibacillus lemnae]|uniref:UPF0102 protein HII30_10195 n=1 Tax=Paenibacillus lemnae TaxID=1330551 RepID=A0A848M4W1_PAELE|nr:YraN family protein [Paenibacillus lemnae]NMO96138.1 YraN family protein [Paenibacillus lemnae]
MNRETGRRKITKQQKGAAAEEAAVRFLMLKGLQILDRNWRCRFGELDIVALDRDQLVFVEVRSRSATGFFGTPGESVDFRKIQQVRGTARQYIHMNHYDHMQIRFDVVAVILSAELEEESLDHIPNAF